MNKVKEDLSKEKNLAERSINSTKDDKAIEDVTKSEVKQDGKTEDGEGTRDMTVSDVSPFSFITKFLYQTVQSMVEFFSSLLGLGLSKVNSDGSEDPVHGKRKREDIVDGEEIETPDDSSVKLKKKRWRPDVVFQAVESFIASLWGAKDSNENLKPSENDENMNSFNTGHEESWNKRPDINFFSDSIVSSIHDVGNHGKS